MIERYSQHIETPRESDDPGLRTVEGLTRKMEKRTAAGLPKTVFAVIIRKDGRQPARRPSPPHPVLPSSHGPRAGCPRTAASRPAVGTKSRSTTPATNGYDNGVSTNSSEHWSLFRSLAFLAATFAIMFGALLPSAVAASAATVSPIMLCSGDQILVATDADGLPQQDKPSPMDSLKCASCVLAALTTLPPPPPVYPVAPRRIVAIQPTTFWTSLPPPLAQTGLRPPSTAPPSA